MGQEYLPQAVGPLISPHYVPEKITRGDVIAASCVFGLTLVWVGICSWKAWDQTKRARNALRSIYIWMIWLEILASFIMSVECWCFIMRLIHPSFAFYVTILLWWCIQVQLLLQIIINRVRVISLSRERAVAIMIGTAIMVTLINISVFTIWIPARLQISERYIRINEVWDRMEKVIYLFVDASLNVYFIKSVRTNLVQNGLQKYNSLLKFNVRIIFISLLMDVMIIAAMSIPNSFVYIQFHPLAYLVKLSIETTMAHLIRKIAVSAAAKRGNGASVHHEFVYGNSSSDGTNTAIELNNSDDRPEPHFQFDGNGIQKTQEVIVRSIPNPDAKQCDIEVISSASTKDDHHGSPIGPEDGDDERPIVHDTWNTSENYTAKISKNYYHAR